jgi:uncharacterized GH25 family protein
MLGPMMHSRAVSPPCHMLLATALAAFAFTAAAQEKGPPVSTRPVRVVVTDESGTPLQGVNVHRSVWTKERFPPNADYATNEKGEATFGVPHQVSIFRLWADKENYVPMFANFDARELKSDPVPQEYTFRLEKGTTIGGVIHDEVGVPIAGAKVEVSLSSRDGKGGVAVVSRWLAFGSACRVTDERGHWSLGNMPDGDHWKVRVKLGHPKLVSDPRERDTKLEELRDQTAVLVMENGVQVRGVIKDPAGQPVAGAMVVWGDEPYHNTNTQETFTNKDGVYQTPPLSAGTATLTVVAPGFSPELKTVKLTPPGVVEDFPLRKGTTVVFQFTDIDDKPIPGVTVRIIGWREMTSLFNWRHPNVPYSKIPDKADENGRYEWTWGPEDAVKYAITKEGYVDFSGEDDEGAPFGPGTHKITLFRE